MVVDISRLQNNKYLPINFITVKKYFDDENDGKDLVETVVINSEPGSIRMQQSMMQNFKFIQLTSEPELWQYFDKYGAQWELFQPLTTDTPEELTVEHPLKQRTEQVSLVSGYQQPPMPGNYGGVIMPQPYTPPRVISVPMLK